MKNRNNAILMVAILVGVATICLAVGQVARSQNSDHKKSPANTGNQEEATPIQEGVMNEKQRAHSKLYKEYRGNGNIFEDAKKNRDFKYIYIGEPDTVSIQSLACEADAVVTGIIQSKSSQVTEGKNFIFTDYEVTVEEIWKDNTATPLDRSALMTVTMPGGAINFNGKVIIAKDASFPPLTIGGRYLFFLAYIPETNLYRPLNSASSFEFKGGRFSEIRKNQIVESLAPEVDSNVLASKVGAALSACK
jgi:hypothetical protein